MAEVEVEVRPVLPIRWEVGRAENDWQSGFLFFSKKQMRRTTRSFNFGCFLELKATCIASLKRCTILKDLILM